MKRIIFILFPLIAVIVASAQEGNINPRSTWDENILNIKLQNVQVRGVKMSMAWLDISTKHLLRANLYMDANTDSNPTTFEFNQDEATGKELLEAFLAAYPTYTYTQDPKTWVIWIHPKRIKYEDILNQKIKIVHPAYQIPASTWVYQPLCRLLSPLVTEGWRNQKFIIGSGGFPYKTPAFFYFVDLPSGVFSVKEILNFCCAASPFKSFIVVPESGNDDNRVSILMRDFCSVNPTSPPPPRDGAVRFWNDAIGKPTNGIPSFDEVSAALSDANPARRWAAGVYWEATSRNYSGLELIRKSEDSEKAVWLALAAESTLYRGKKGIGIFDQFMREIPGFSDNLRQIKNPGLALVTSLELTRANRDTSYLDTIVSKHTYSEAEIVSIKPDVYRLAHESPLVLDKLKAMKIDVPEFSPEALHELEDTNLFTLVPAEAK